MVLDPHQKYFYFYTHWDEEHHDRVKQKTQALYNEFRIDDVPADSQQSTKIFKVDDFDINVF